MKLIATSFLLAGLAFTQAPPVPPPVAKQAPQPPPPLTLSETERLELENLTLKLKLFQQELQAQYQAFQGSIKQYEDKVKAAHPGLAYQLNSNSLTWEPIQAKPVPAVAPATAPAKPEAPKAK